MPDMKYIDDIADEVTEGSGEDSGMDDEDSTEALFPGADARDYHIALAIESLQEELSRAPTPIQGGCLILPDILSRSPTPLAPYQPEPMLGSRAPTPAYEVDSPRARTPLFMPMSEDEDDPSDTDRSNSTSTAKPGARRAPSPHRSSRPTAKRRRIQPPPDKSLKAFANAFLDLEAEDDADEEDDGDDDDGVPTADFIDDNPIDDEPIVVVDDSDDEDVFTSQANEAERAEALAAHFHEMARQNRTVVENADSSPHDIVSRLPDSSDPDLYRFGVPRGRQMQLLDYLYRCTGVKSVFFRDRGAAGRKRPKFETVAVYVETDDLAALERAMAKHVGAYAMLSRKPVPVDVEHRVLSTLAQSTILVGRWARVRSGSSLYQGDLVFVEDESNYLVVPRLEYERLSQTPDRPPARLFDSKKCVAAGNQVQQFNKYRVWRQRLFVEGLEQRFYVPSQLTLEGIVPTGDEEQWARFDQHRGLFNGSSHHALVAPFVGPYCALQEGDRVVVVSGKHSGKAGYIVAVTTTQLRDINTQRQQLVRLAAVLERYDGATAITRSSLQMAGHPALFVPVSALRLHALAFVRPLLVGDRVVAVGGAAQGISGRIESMHHSGHVTFRPSPPMENADAAMEIQMCDVRREFRVGDVVKVNRNLRDILQGAVGFITEVCTGGFVHLYQCALPRLLSAMSSQKADCESVVDNVADEPSMYIPTTHLDFALVDDNGLAVHSSVSPSVRQELDETTREWEKMKMSTGRAYIGCEIMVAGKQAASYARKGLFGTVLGYTVKQSTETRLRKTRAQGLKDGRTSAGPDVELHVRYDGSMEGVPVKLNQVVER
ncbi:hypothetical protein C8R47DRAFT_1146784 [Mycena vitilis]|nr:hypothetical protein C8R47DRAFT_1146784 [Mycena vitilis]